MKNIIKHFNNFKLGTKLIVCFLIISIASLSFSTFIYQKINEKIMTEKVSEMALQTLQTIDANLDLLIYTVNNESKILLSNQNLQSILRNGNSKFSYSNLTTLNRYLTEFIQSNIFISSIYVFDNFGNKFYVDKKYVKEFNLRDIKNAPWYSDLTDAKGGYLIKLNGGMLFEEKGRSNVSLIRIINDLESQKPIGTMVINIPEEAIINAFQNVKSQGDTTILLKDNKLNDIIHSDSNIEKSLVTEIHSKMKNNSYYSIEKVKGKSYINSYLRNSLGWTVISKVPYNELSKQSNIYKLVITAMLILNFLVSFLGLILVSIYITKPIKELIKAMKGVENGEFNEVKIETGNDEIGKLKKVYNRMIVEIQKLIGEIIKEQKIKRKAELNVLQAQIKPHFLYNSFDAVSSLALDGRNDEVYKLIKALGSFYRTSLSNGKEVITLQEELQTVKSYLTIQQIRYDNIFDIQMELDERANKCKILKLVLQPLVENSIYHGIKPARKKGRIFISSNLKEGYVELVVEDDGVGICEEKLQQMKGDPVKGIGLHGTMGRLNIFYNGKSSFSIDSKEGEGTRVTINIPIEGEGYYE